ncbi:hypothetical protein J2X43_005573 [Rhizobium sp. BE258]|jgi:hypothetical protein|nr:hypothetical protein [Rhizobium sp. BE258]
MNTFESSGLNSLIFPSLGSPGAFQAADGPPSSDGYAPASPRSSSGARGFFWLFPVQKAFGKPACFSVSFAVWRDFTP